MTIMSFERNLFLASPLMKGEDVLAVQRALAARGADLLLDGQFGRATDTAVRALQAQAGLVQDGVVGLATRAALFGAEAAASRATEQGAARRCVDLLRANWSVEQACGIAANIAAESGFDPEAVGDRGTAYGLAQWHPDRQEAFRQFHGRDIVGSAVEEQLEFITFELTKGREQRAGKLLQAARTPREAGEIVSRYYERPAAADAQAQVRGLGADALFTRLQDKPAEAAATPLPAAPVIPPPRTVSDIVGTERVRALLKPHGLFKDGASWYLSEDGIGLAGGDVMAAEAADRDLVHRTLGTNAPILASVLGQGQVPVELVLAALCAASDANGGVRLLPGGDLGDPDRTPQAVCCGLMQTTLSLARAAVGRPDLTVASLSAPDMAIRAGVGAIWLQAMETGFDPPLVAAMYSAGSLCYDPNSRWRLLQYPLGGADYIDRFIRFFNAAMQVVGSVVLPPRICSFGDLIDAPGDPGAPPDGHGRYIAPAPLAFIGASPVGTGQCVALVREATGAPAAATWHRGGLVRGDTTLLPGTAIATFDDNGRYGNRADGTCHAALYLGQDEAGIDVVDQWKGQNPHRRPLHFNRPDSQPVNRGEAFFVVA